ncbi:MAG: heavy metal translocating P-type ATPase metal-binding domain-containing protein [Verrucomicrobiota bacterium]
MEAVARSFRFRTSRGTTCAHCGSRFDSRGDADERFCCSGCRFVHELIQEEGLDRFYDLKDGTVTPPVGSRAAVVGSWGWLEDARAKAEREQQPRLRLAVQGISCIGCVWLIENRFRSLPGARRISLSPNRGSVELRWEPGAFDLGAFARDLSRFGYTLSEAGVVEPEPDGLTRRLALCGAFAMNAMAFTLPRYLGMPAEFMFASLFEMVAAFSATLSLAVGGSYFVGRAWNGLRADVLSIDTPIALGVLAAYIGSLVGWLTHFEGLLYFDFVAVFIFLMLAGRRLQTAALETNRRRLKAIDFENSTCARTDGKPGVVGHLKSEDGYWMEPGQMVPVTSRVQKEGATLSLESITGEPEPRFIEPGGLAPSGARFLGQKRVEVKAMESWEDSILCRLRGAQGSDAKVVSGLDRVLRIYLATILVVGIGGGLVWMVATGNVTLGLQVMISIFVVSCPCALGVAIPLADDLAVSRLERMGVYVRSRKVWPKLLRVRKLLFDKTGTLTNERPVLRNPAALQSLSPRALARLRLLVNASWHPVCRSLADHVGEAEGEEGVCEEVVGVGVQTVSEEGTWKLAKGEGREGTVLSLNGRPLVTFCFEDTSRSGAAGELARLASEGYEIHVLSGDATSRVRAVAGALGLSPARAYGDLSPEGKVAKIKALGGADALFVGDGANDSLAVSEVLCSGATVPDRSLLHDKVDFYVLGNAFTFLSPLIQTARWRLGAIRRAGAFAIAYNLICLTIALSGSMNPLLAAVLMPVSSVVTVAITGAHWLWVSKSGAEQVREIGERARGMS